MRGEHNHPATVLGAAPPAAPRITPAGSEGNPPPPRLTRRTATLAAVSVVLLLVSLLLAVREPLFGRRFVLPSPAAEPPGTNLLVVHYHERAPYYSNGPAGVSGCCGEPVRRALNDLGLACRWQETPPARQLLIVQQNHGWHAALGWFRTPERSAYATFSVPIYQDRPAVALARAGDMRFAAGRSVTQALANPNLVLLVKQAYSYGAWLDDQIRRHAPRRLTTSAGNVSMLKMVQARRADYFFLAEEEAAELVAASGEPPSRYQRVRFTDMPAGGWRHLMFSRQVPATVIAQINAALTAGAATNRPAAP